jgi:hypothetical protein
MSATLTAGSSVPAAIAGRAGIPFGRLLRAELRKLTDTRAGRWLLIAIAAITVLVVVIALFTVPARDLTYSKLVDYTQTPQKLLLHRFTRVLRDFVPVRRPGVQRENT